MLNPVTMKGRPSPGDVLVVTHQGRTYRGPITEVEDVTYRGKEPCDNVFYFNFTHDDLSYARTGDPGRYKMGIDPGEVFIVRQAVAR